MVVVGIALRGSTLLYAEPRHLQFVQGILRLSRDLRGGRESKAHRASLAALRL
jgi:hypothetical protein